MTSHQSRTWKTRMRDIAPIEHEFNHYWIPNWTTTTHNMIRWADLTQRKLASVRMARLDETAARRNVSVHVYRCPKSPDYCSWHSYQFSATPSCVGSPQCFHMKSGSWGCSGTAYSAVHAFFIKQTKSSWAVWVIPLNSWAHRLTVCWNEVPKTFSWKIFQYKWGSIFWIGRRTALQKIPKQDWHMIWTIFCLGAARQF